MISIFGKTKTIGIAALMFCLGVEVSATSALSAAGPTRVKLATIAPKGTSLHQVLQGMGEKWRRAPGGGVALTIYTDGTMGGEAEMVRRIRVGQIEAAMLSVQGLSEIDASVTALQNVPMLFRSLDEVDYLRGKLRPELEKRLLDKGFVVLFWGDVGWVRFFSKNPGTHPGDFERMKLFTWAGSNEQVELLKAAGFHPVPLETNDILPGLQTGLINAVDTAPLYALAGQFYGPCPHMLDLNWAPLGGATVITKKVWDSIPSAAHDELLNAAKEAGEEVTMKSRAESDEAVEAMKKRGLKVQPVSPEIEAEWRQLVEATYPKIRGALVPADVFDEVQRLLREYRAAGARGK